MDEESVRGYIEHSQEIIRDSPQMDEANTKAAILQPEFLDLLNWKIPQNTQLEYSVEAFGQTYKVDYALILEGTPVAFIEAKGVDTSLTERHDEQLSSYMTNKNVSYGILTNGERYRFFQRQVDGANVSVQQVADIQLEDLVDRIAILRAYTVDSIQSGESARILGRINELRQSRKTLESEKDNLASEITNLLTESVSDVISSPVESQAKEMIDRVITDIEMEIDTDGSSSTVEAPSNTQPESTEELSDIESGYIVRIHDAGNTLAEFEDEIQSDVIADAVDYLIENENLISKIEPLPYIPGREKAIINNEPASPHDEKAMRAYRELAGGYYLDTHANQDGKKRTMSTLTEECDLEVSFSGEW
ncbi:type I restriction enzyme HsdR N-terminal domain-containing protein [Natronomonas sp. F2-12]|uniref:Type I restriction enzyme HsdR N-terminal domain-containing protein n=1 Tax=Natronomonas aquatica TaxID=2841590 RepID=A0A9R1CQA6_9EURY|nr:type I restriction enzyme HsdR N-terminal domain-containing protein [Natronomonas aquatica]MCQ4331950.1 type I restriction enzyme HsdR N-terminal domain-containing protein [Natronomonas aquatica]